MIVLAKMSGLPLIYVMQNGTDQEIRTSPAQPGPCPVGEITDYWLDNQACNGGRDPEYGDAFHISSQGLENP